LKPERWGSPLVQEKYQEERACDKRHPYRIIVIIIIIIIIINIQWHISSIIKLIYGKKSQFFLEYTKISKMTLVANSHLRQQLRL